MHTEVEVDDEEIFSYVVKEMREEVIEEVQGDVLEAINGDPETTTILLGDAVKECVVREWIEQRIDVNEGRDATAPAGIAIDGVNVWLTIEAVAIADSIARAFE